MSPDAHLPHDISPAIDATREHYESPRMFGRSSRRALHTLASSLGIDPNKHRTDRALWGAVAEKIDGGVQNTADPIMGDPFAIFVAGTCWGTEEHPHPEHRQIAVHKTTHRVDEFEGKKIAQFLKDQPPVHTCDRTLDSGDECGATITSWSVQNTRMGTFREQERLRDTPGQTIIAEGAR